jgi:hypothetical protein
VSMIAPEKTNFLRPYVRPTTYVGVLLCLASRFMHRDHTRACLACRTGPAVTTQLDLLPRFNYAYGLKQYQLKTFDHGLGRHKVEDGTA